MTTVPPPDRFARDLPFGATVLPNGRTRFRVWAPTQKSVALAIECGPPIMEQKPPTPDRRLSPTDPVSHSPSEISAPVERPPLLPMTSTGDGWFELVTPCAPGTHYRYCLADGTLVPDPASRFQPDDVHGPSMVVDPRAYRWRCADWLGRPWRETVLYELHAGVLGGYRGVVGELPRLRDLGITAIELMPIADFPGRRNWGYDGVLPFAPDSAYGTPDELKALIDDAHGLGLMVFLDVVANHLGPDGNWLYHLAPPFFRQRDTPWGAAPDFSRSEVRSFFTENVLYWLMEYRFDGLRFDAVAQIDEQDWFLEMAAAARAAVEPGRHVHLVQEHHNAAEPLRAGINAQWNDDAHRALHVLLTGETSGYFADHAARPAEHLARCLAEGWSFQGEHSAYYGAARGEPSADLPPTAQVLFLQNHDQIGNRALGERLTVLADPAALEAAIALLLLCPQIPLLFMGEETASRAPFLFFTNHHARLAEAVREGRRREFARFADFADPANRARIPDPNDPATFAASFPAPDPANATEREALYRRLLALRREQIVPWLDDARSAGAQAIGPAAVQAAWTLGGGGRLTLAINLAAEPVAFAPSFGHLLFASRELPVPGPVLPAASPLLPDRPESPAGNRGMLPGYCTAAFLEALR